MARRLPFASSLLAAMALASLAEATPPPPPGASLVAPSLACEAEVAAASPPAPRADASLQREGRSAFGGGYLAITPDFASSDGTYDLVIHFHGNTELVEQSLAYARIGAVFVPLNLGAGSAVYDERFGAPDAFADVLARVEAAMVLRGLTGARLGRVALVAWSAGFGAVRRILDQPASAERVDAVILLDAIHVGRVAGGRAPELAELAPYERFARRAMMGEKLFTITHSEIAPDAFVGARETTDLLLARLGVLRYADGEEAVIPPLPAVEGVLTKRRREPLQPLTLADAGKLTVRGYAGDGPDHHVFHLMEMATIGLPDLARWWSRSRDASP